MILRRAPLAALLCALVAPTLFACKSSAAFTAKFEGWHILFAALRAAQPELSTAFTAEISVGWVFVPQFEHRIPAPLTRMN